MSFRKRNVGVTGSSRPKESATEEHDPRISPKGSAEKLPPLGVRPSPVDGSPIISTGTPSLDNLLAGHAGLVLGNVLLIEESGATDYAATLLRYYAAEGILQGHHVHVVGVGEQWGRELPGLARGSKGQAEKEVRSSTGDAERMRIAWRYERFGESSTNSRGLGQRSLQPGEDAKNGVERVFCHEFDLTKRLELPSHAKIDFLGIRSTSASSSPFLDIISNLNRQLSTSADSAIHRVIIPSILSPAYYPPSSCLPQHVLRFFHALRSLLRQHTGRLSAMVSLPITLYPRETGLTRWMELLSDGVLELVPFPHTIDSGPSLATSGAATSQEEKPQGMARIHRLPVFHERGGGMPGIAGVGDDLAFTVTRKRFMIKPFSLPPIEGDTDAQRGEVEGKPAKAQLEF